MKERAKEIALCIDYNSNYYRSIVGGVARYSGMKGWRFFTSRGIPQISLHDLKSWEGTGVIGRLSPELIADLQRRGIPAVNIKSDYLNLPVASVLMDNMATGKLAAEYLIEKGVRRFAATAWSIKGASGNLKVQGFIEGLEARGFRATVLESYKEIQKLDQILQVEKGETVGVFAAEDFLGRMVIEACEDHGLRVPEDVAVMGCDNSPFICEMVKPTMTSVELGAERVGYQAASLLDSLIQHGEIPSEPIMVAPERIVERQSTDILEIGDELVAKSLRFIRANASRPITVGEVTDALFCNRRVLEKRFKTEVGRTLHEEIRRSRIERACKLLRESDMLVEVLAEACGYSSRERFNAAFRRETGKTPSAYRKEYRFANN
ncbi:Xylose operon regulatory protein [Pontiella desulfatans]|uniref:Xylose operon regulatory protein n=1 Tax=Pontiella desulfatans TaxID=2750659 RepID=A0A6C2U5X3_PONDE|nr:DNA-binding transcriptional regulator [Pontiella desulfatans]VGO15478.1 Xylose operon regulatory protein [Pontiella desulfatans]